MEVGKYLCLLGFHSLEVKHPFNVYGPIYGKIGFICKRKGCEKEENREANHFDYAQYPAETVIPKKARFCIALLKSLKGR